MRSFDEDIYDEFVEGIVGYAEDIKVGNGLEGTDMGPQVSSDELDSTLNCTEIGQEEGAILEIGGT